MRNLFTALIILHGFLGGRTQSIYYQSFNNASFPAGWTPSDTRIALSNQAVSSGYSSSSTSPPSSGGNNVRFNDCAPIGQTVTLTAAGIVSTTGQNNIRVGFGMRTSMAWGNQMTFEWSSDGSVWNLISSDVSAGASTEWSTIYFDLPPEADNVANLRFRFSYVTSLNSNCDFPPNFRLDDFIVGANASLPVELAAFEARLYKQGALLAWRTETETNNAHFLIERSPDGQAFTEIGRVHGAGTIRESQSYTFTDPSPLPGANYYRLRQVDFDGRFNFSSVKLVMFEDPAAAPRLFPSPASEFLHLHWAQATELELNWEIVDATGQRLHTGNIPPESTDTDIRIDHLPAGTYFLRIRSAQQHWAKPFVKIN